MFLFIGAATHVEAVTGISHRLPVLKTEHQVDGIT
jgi:hypothetical protein